MKKILLYLLLFASLFGAAQTPQQLFWTNNQTIATGSYDVDAQAFFTAAGITDDTQKNAVNQLVTSLKSAGIWAKCRTIYPMVGGNATAHAVNLRSPGTYDLSFFNSPTHSASGVDWNGTNQYAKTGFIPLDALSQFSVHLSYYSTEQTSSGVGDMGCFSNSDTKRLALFLLIPDNAYFETGLVMSGTNTNSQGFFIGTRTSSALANLYKNGSTIMTSTDTETQTLPSNEISIGALNYNGNFTAVTSDRNCAFASIGDGLTDSEAAAFYTIVQIYETALGRQV